MESKSEELLCGATVQSKRLQIQLWKLPMNILCDIMSRLPIRGAIRTSILSRQCKNLWRDHTKLTFSHYTLRRDCDNPSPYGFRLIDAQEFIARVDAVLQQHNGIGVDRMEALQLTSVSLNLPPDFNGFLNLQRLSMVDVNITEEHVEYLLSKCNLLEFLEIACCRNLTSIRALHPMNQLKHLQVEHCTFLKRIEMNCGLTTLKYSGPMVPLEFATTSRLRSERINKLLSFDSALDYITTGFPGTLPHLETLNLRCAERERAILPLRSLKYNYLRKLRLELTIFGYKESKTDVLDYAYLLDAAPFMEKLELHMWMDCHHQPYCTGHGELRCLPSQSHQHIYLKLVKIIGFFGHKDQVELAFHILHISAVLKKMKIDPRVKIIPGGRYAAPATYKLHNYVDGYMVAAEFVRGTCHNNVLEVVGMSPTM